MGSRFFLASNSHARGFKRHPCVGIEIGGRRSRSRSPAQRATPNPPAPSPVSQPSAAQPRATKSKTWSLIKLGQNVSVTQTLNNFPNPLNRHFQINFPSSNPPAPSPQPRPPAPTAIATAAPSPQPPATSLTLPQPQPPAPAPSPSQQPAAPAAPSSRPPKPINHGFCKPCRRGWRCTARHNFNSCVGCCRSSKSND